MSELSIHASLQPTVIDEDEGPASPDALVHVFNEMRDELVSTLWFMLGNAEDAQDAAQDAFLKCWRAQDRIKDVCNLRSWIFRVGLNAARDLQRSAWHRRSRQFDSDAAMMSDSEAPPGQVVEDQEMLENLRRAIMHLRQDEKEVFLLRQNGELTFEQIAELRQNPVGTVKTQMRSALQKLRKVLG